MTRTQRRLAIFAGVILALLALGWYATRPKPVAVLVKPVERGTVERSVANTRAGTVEACRRAKLSPSIGGQIARLDIKEGDEVEPGQLLLELWNEDLKARVELARSEARAARARVEAACAQAEVAKREAERLVKLRKTGVSSEEATERAVSVAKARKAECNASVATAQVSAASLKVSEANLERTQLSAPFKGVVAEISGELNEYVTPSPIGIATPPAVDLIDNTCFYVAAPIDEVDAPLISTTLPARITLDAFGDRHFEGRVRRIGAYVLDLEKQARTVDVEAEFIHPQDIKQLLAGYSADVEIILETREQVLRIPAEALMEDARVLVFDAQSNTLVERKIGTGIANWDFVEVREGLGEGEQVVTSIDRAGVAAGAMAVIETPAP